MAATVPSIGGTPPPNGGQLMVFIGASPPYSGQLTVFIARCPTPQYGDQLVVF